MLQDLRYAQVIIVYSIPETITVIITYRPQYNAMGGAFMNVIRWRGGVLALLSREHLRVPFHYLNSNMATLCETLLNHL